MRIDSSRIENFLIQELLCAGVRMSDRNGFGGVIGAGSKYHGQDRVFICLGILKPLENYGAHAVSSTIAVRFVVKCGARAFLG